LPLVSCQASQVSGSSAAVCAAVPAVGDLGGEASPRAARPRACPYLAADLPLVADHRVDAGVDDDLVAVAAPPHHACFALRSVSGSTQSLTGYKQGERYNALT
jgi:hypothetical protein